METTVILGQNQIKYSPCSSHSNEAVFCGTMFSKEPIREICARRTVLARLRDQIRISKLGGSAVESGGGKVEGVPGVRYTLALRPVTETDPRVRHAPFGSGGPHLLVPRRFGRRSGQPESKIQKRGFEGKGFNISDVVPKCVVADFYTTGKRAMGHVITIYPVMGHRARHCLLQYLLCLPPVAEQLLANPGSPTRVGLPARRGRRPAVLRSRSHLSPGTRPSNNWFFHLSHPFILYTTSSLSSLPLSSVVYGKCCFKQACIPPKKVHWCEILGSRRVFNEAPASNLCVWMSCIAVEYPSSPNISAVCSTTYSSTKVRYLSPVTVPLKKKGPMTPNANIPHHSVTSGVHLVFN
ncbi:hypothetical protein J6590_012756 [Homalodisca vitripennis]|nr:hypothetical protein J6590_012756 [Homalodisca vitripennis]